MLSVNGIFDGSKIKLLEKVPIKKAYKVIVTFVEEVDDETNAIRDFSSQSKALDFWVAKEEDLYQDYLNPKKESK